MNLGQSWTILDNLDVYLIFEESICIALCLFDVLCLSLLWCSAGAASLHTSHPASQLQLSAISHHMWKCKSHIQPSSHPATSRQSEAMLEVRCRPRSGGTFSNLAAAARRGRNLDFRRPPVEKIVAIVAWT